VWESRGRREYTFAQKLSCLNPKGMATESSEGNITAFGALVQHLNEANRVAYGDAAINVTCLRRLLSFHTTRNIQGL